MTKTLKKHFLFLFLSFMATMAWGAEVEIDGISYLLDATKSEASVAVRKPKYEGVISIPSTIHHEGASFRVVKVGVGAFYHCEALTAVSLPEGITELERHAFAGCSQLMAVNLPKSLKTMGQHAFSRCERLASITLPEGIKEVPAHAFAGCSALSLVRLPEGLEGLGASAFEGCTTLRELRLPKSLEWVGREALAKCASLANIEFAEGLTLLGDRAFAHCSSLRELSLPKSLGQLPANALEECERLSRLELPSTLRWAVAPNELPYGLKVVLRVVEGNAQADMGDWRAEVEEVAFEPGLSHLADFSLQGCTGIKEIELPQGLQSIGQAAFEGCTSLEWISLPESLQSIGRGALQACGQLQQMLVHHRQPMAIDELADEPLYERVGLLVPPGSLEAYRSAPIWQKFKNISESHLASIDQSVAAPQAEREAPIYTLQGKRISAQELGSLPAGLYIKGGKVVSLGQ